VFLFLGNGNSRRDHNDISKNKKSNLHDRSHFESIIRVTFFVAFRCKSQYVLGYVETNMVVMKGACLLAHANLSKLKLAEKRDCRFGYAEIIIFLMI
jgi:hypothetical protein